MEKERGLLLVGEKGNAVIDYLCKIVQEKRPQTPLILCQPQTLSKEFLAAEIIREKPVAMFFSASFFCKQFSEEFNLHNFLCELLGVDCLHTVMLCSDLELEEASIFGAEELLLTPLQVPAIVSCLRRLFSKERTILLVEPDYYKNIYFKTTLGMANFLIYSAFNLSEAQEMAVSVCPDLILCCSVLSSKNKPIGAESLLKILRQQHFTTQIPVLAYASQGSAGEIENILQAGAVDYVILSVADLVQRVEFQFKRHYGRKQKILITGSGSTGGAEIRRMLGRQNFQVFTSIELTRNLADGTEPDLLIVDNKDDNNNECFAFLQREDTKNSVPVILIGTEKSSLLPQKCVVLRVDDILLKPYTLSAFLRSIEGAFLRRMAQQNEVRRREVEKEFLIGNEIQKSIMSEKSIRLDNKITVDSVWLPAQILGGDFFGVFRTFEEQGKIIVCIADVCGKGLSAALVAVGAHSSLYSSAQFFTSPALLLNGLNHFLCSSSLMEEFFLTIFIACIDFKNGRLQYAVAGHNEMLFYSASQKEFIELSSEFFPGGIMDDVEYENEPSMDFSVGDRLILYTDGITEALNAQGKQFSKARLMESLHRHIHLSNGRELAEAVSRDVRKYIGEAKQSDDITILVVEALS